VFRYPGYRSSSRPCRTRGPTTLMGFDPSQFFILPVGVACVSTPAGPPVVRRASASMLFVRGIGRQDLPIVTDRRLFTHENRRSDGPIEDARFDSWDSSRQASRSLRDRSGPQSRPFFVGSADPAMGFASFRFRGHRSMRPAGHDPDRAIGLRRSTVCH